MQQTYSPCLNASILPSALPQWLNSSSTSGNPSWSKALREGEDFRPELHKIQALCPAVFPVQCKLFLLCQQLRTLGKENI